MGDWGAISKYWPPVKGHQSNCKLLLTGANLSKNHSNTAQETSKHCCLSYVGSFLKKNALTQNSHIVAP